ncbi:MAG: glycosyltransferase family 2 protein [Odoribacter sp.]
MTKAAVIILNWNGEKLLKEFLPSVIKNTNHSTGRVIVADNASEDKSVEILEKEFPGIEVIRFDQNYGFAGGYNRAIELVDEEIIVLLNSDVEVVEGWLEPLIDVIEQDPQVAAVQPKIKAYRNKDYFEYAGACGGYIDRLGFPFCRGRILDVVEKDNAQYDDMVEVFWCSGAALCIRKKAYCQSGGLDERFFAHMEEIDLCWRMRNQGWKLKVNPLSVVYHLGGGSLPMNHPRKLFLNYRNNLLMLYKNLDSRKWEKVILQRRFLDFAAMMMFLLKGEISNVKSIILAYREFSKMKRFYVPSDTEHKDACIFQGSLIFEYYFKHIRRFSQLWQ